MSAAPSGIEALYDLYASSVFTYALRLVGDRSAAENITQEVFLAAWQALAKFRGEAAIKTWLLGIAHFKVVDWFRKRRPALSLDDDGEYHVYASIADPRAEEQLQWLDEDLGWALKKLKPSQRAVVELVFRYGLSYSEVAAIIQRPIGTVKSRLHYALRHLRRLMASA